MYKKEPYHGYFEEPPDDRPPVMPTQDEIIADIVARIAAAGSDSIAQRSAVSNFVTQHNEDRNSNNIFDEAGHIQFLAGGLGGSPAFSGSTVRGIPAPYDMAVRTGGRWNKRDAADARLIDILMMLFGGGE